MIKSSGKPRSAARPGNVAVLIAITLLLACSLTFNTRGAADDRDGKRNSTVGPKRSSQRTGSKNNQPHYQDPNWIQTADSTGRILATADFDLIGLAVTASPATQTVPKNTPTAVLTSVQAPPGANPSEIIAGLDPDLRVRGELTGPSLSSPLALEARIGEPLPIPALSRAGDHAVHNLRVVDTGAADNPVVAPVTPDTCGIVVIDQLLVSEVRVEEMSYEDIVRSGITITDDSYQFFNFVLAIATSSGIQHLNTPVAFPQVGAADPRPVVGRPTTPVSVGVNVPDMVPVMLTLP
ncbi:MAG TPA: hypothetical protein VG778_06795, partial [Blastocatellia bacterium]|nr:hypothetical protein [Blastocatellia bacterium]